LLNKKVELTRKQYKVHDFKEFETSKVLSYPLGSTIKSFEEIQAVFTFFFEWPEYGKATLHTDHFEKQVNIFYHNTKKEFWIDDLKGVDPSFLKLQEKVSITLEIFYMEYQFFTQLDLSHSKNYFTFSFPQKMKISSTVLKKRVHLPEPIPAILESENSRQKIHLLELGIKTIKIQENFSLPEKGTLQVQDLKIPIQSHQSHILEIHHDSQLTAGLYFDLYRKAAFPFLVEKTHSNLEEFWNAYLQSGYLSKFNLNKDRIQRKSNFDFNDYKERILKTWKSILPDKHQTHITYGVQNLKGEIIGASGLALAFIQDQTPIWAIHQLCIMCQPEYIERARDLYTWRFEYLLNSPMDHEIVAWINPKNRLISRIWMKYACYQPKLAYSSTSVHTKIHHFQRKKNSTLSQLKIHSQKIGQEKRFFFLQNNYSLDMLLTI